MQCVHYGCCTRTAVCRLKQTPFSPTLPTLPLTKFRPGLDGRRALLESTEASLDDVGRGLRTLDAGLSRPVSAALRPWCSPWDVSAAATPAATFGDKEDDLFVAPT